MTVMAAMVAPLSATSSTNDLQPPPGTPGLPGIPGMTPPSGLPETGNTLVSLKAESTISAIHPGETFHLAFTFKIRPLWHIYWINPGDSGTPTDIEIDAPEGFEIGEILWPRPLVIAGPLVTYGYEDEVTLFVPITAPAELEAGQVTFRARVDWLVCKEQCLLGEGRREITVSTQSGPAAPKRARGAEPMHESLRKQYDRIPVSARGLKDVRVEFEGDRLLINAPAHGRREAVFLPILSPGVRFGAPVYSFDGDRVVMTVDVTVNPDHARGRPMHVSGVLALGTDQSHPAYHVTQPLGESR